MIKIPAAQIECELVLSKLLTRKTKASFDARLLFFCIAWRSKANR